MLLELAKSGIVSLVLISVFGGYLIGQRFELEFDGLRLLITLAGILLLASGSSALNQYQEQTLDRRMPRTAKRPLPSGRITPRAALVFIVASLALGLLILAWLDVQLLWLGISAVILYNGLYTPWWKRNWAFAAVPGAVPGALPIWMGHVAASGDLWSAGGLYLFFLLFFWQMPHFWVLALKYRADYASGDIPTLPVAHGEPLTHRQIAVWALAYVGVGLIAPLFIDLSPLYLVGAILIGGKVLWELWGFSKSENPVFSKAWLRFFLWVNFSLILYIFLAALDLWSIYLRQWIETN